MTSSIITGVKRFPRVHRMARSAKSGIHEAACAGTQQWISRAGDYEILVLLGMRRSGNHLAINWILGQCPGSAVFYNNIPADTHPFDAVMKEFRFRPRRGGRRIILSYEDLTPQEMMSGPLPEFLVERVTRDHASLRAAVILRDPYNLFASRLTKWPERFASDEAIARQRELYRVHASLAAEPEPVVGDRPVVPILFNRLVAEADYRATLARDLAIRDGSVGLDEVPFYGHGSSYDGGDQSRVQAGVFERWRDSLSDPRFVAAITSADNQALAERLFGITSPL